MHNHAEIFSKTQLLHYYFIDLLTSSAAPFIRPESITQRIKERKKVQNSHPSLYESHNADKGKGTEDFILL